MTQFAELAFEISFDPSYLYVPLASFAIDNETEGTCDLYI